MSPRTGRPPKDNAKDKQYRLRLSEEDLEKLDFCTKMTNLSKADVMRRGLEELYNNLNCLGYDDLDDNTDDEDYPDNISLSSVVYCPYCGKAQSVDFGDFLQGTESNNRGMGEEIEYSILAEYYACHNCGKDFKIEGSLWEYPIGILNHEEIHTIAYEEEDDD